VASPRSATWADLPADRVVQLDGATPEQLAVALDALPADAPAVIRYHPTTVPGNAATLIADILDRLDDVARGLFPAWLPAADHLAGSSDFDRRVVRQLAHSLASTTTLFGPFLADVAEAALLKRPTQQRFGAETRARGVAAIIARAYQRDRVVLMIDEQHHFHIAEQRRIGSACEWLVNHGRIGVWLLGDVLPAIDRIASATVPIPDYIESLTPRRPCCGDAAPGVVEFPAVTGRPHPASAAEQRLEEHLSGCGWAAGRVWNQLHGGHLLEPPIRVDLMWPELRCAIEIDGPDHRGVLKYADDRRRDNTLVLAGFAVLRFSNGEVTDDTLRVAAIIERLLTARRSEAKVAP
jgi:hypothetical protein